MKTFKILLTILTLFFLTSCYSVRIKVTNGPGPEPIDTETAEVTAGELVRVLDTVVKVAKTTRENPINIPDCKSGALHSVQYKSTFGGILRYLVTFGRHRTVKVKYVCVKKTNIGVIELD